MGDTANSSTDTDVLISPNNSSEIEPPKGCCHPKSSAYRFIALILMCLLGFGKEFSLFIYCNESYI